MPTYYVEMVVCFVGEYEADNKQEAERLAVYDDTCHYEGVEDISITEIEEDEEDEEES